MTKSEEFPPITLKTDGKLGLYFLCDETGADDLRDCLKGDKVAFSYNPNEGAHLLTAGKVLFVFAKSHPRYIADTLEEIGEEVILDSTVVMPEDTYLPPVRQLVDLGELDYEERLDYVALGISRADAAELIRMAMDVQLHEGPSDSPMVYAPVHAWRALIQLQVVEIIPTLVQLLQRADDWDECVSEQLPKDLAEFGAAALDPVTTYLADATKGDWSRVAATKTIQLVAETHPELRVDCITRLIAQLERLEEQSETLNGFLISSLWDLRALEAMPVVERAFASGRVDESIHGDFEDMQIEFGLKTKRERPRKPNMLSRLAGQFNTGIMAANERVSRAAGSHIESETEPHTISLPYIAAPKVGRNDPCSCGSGKKFKKCCGK